jgi:hypothetical protein
MAWRRPKPDYEAIDKAFFEAEKFYRLVKGSMAREMNLTVETRVASVVFLFGAVAAAGDTWEMSPADRAAAFVLAQAASGVGEDDAQTMGKFALEVMDEGDEDWPWTVAFVCGGEAYEAFRDGSDVRALELLAEAIETAPPLEPAPTGSLAPEVARILR